MADLFKLFTDALTTGNVIAKDRAVNIAHLLASHHLLRGSTPLDVRARLLETDAVQGIDRNAMYLIIQWVEQSQSGRQPVTAVIKVTFVRLDLDRLSLVIHYGEDLFQKQSQYQWLSWLDPDDIKDILIAGGQELGLLPTSEYPRNRQLILVYDP